jgi:membrane dipeptidase
MFCPQYLGGDGLEPVVAHLTHIINTVGEDAAALGSDWDGFIVPTRGLADPRGLPDLTDALLKHGVPRRAIGKLLRDNVARLLRDNPLPVR